MIVTANHCFDVGWSIYTGSNAHLVGRVTGSAPAWDALTIAGKNNADEWGNSNVYHPLVSTAYSYQHDLVCQDGYTSFKGGFGTICGIEVTDPDVTWYLSESPHQPVRGVRGHQTQRLTAARPGDSGALVFTLAKGAPDARQVRGIVSATPLDRNGDEIPADLYWTEAIDIFHHLTST